MALVFFGFLFELIQIAKKSGDVFVREAQKPYQLFFARFGRHLFQKVFSNLCE